eukprot:14181515-Alexandrium_andersonii.AAC.1
MLPRPGGVLGSLVAARERTKTQAAAAASARAGAPAGRGAADLFARGLPAGALGRAAALSLRRRQGLHARG